MANADRPRGLEPYGDVKRTQVYQAGANIKPGDAVKKSADGKIDPVDTGGASYTSSVLGVALSIAADGEDCLVADHPDQIFRVQADGSDIDAQTDIHLNYGILATNADSTYELSRMELDSDTGATTASLPLKLLRIDDRPDNALGAQVDCIVKINNHELAGGTGTAAS